MQLVRSLDQYLDLIEGKKKTCGRLKTNCPLFPDALERYIGLGRLFWEDTDAGLIIYTDEETFYQAYFHVVPGTPFRMKAAGKPVIIQDIYQGEKKPWLVQVEAELQKNGFYLANTMKHGVFTGYEGIPRLRRMESQTRRIFERAGLSMVPLTREMIPEMIAFRAGIKEIPFYEFPYYTDDELMEETKSGRLLAVVDASGKIIAARHLIVNGKKAYGWVGVQEEYKSAYGVALMFLFHALDYIQENDIKMCSWVDCLNVPSLQYHEHLGTQWTGHLQSVWIRE